MWGRGPSAYDCWGLVRDVMREGLGVTLPSYVEYADSVIGGDGERVLMEKMQTLTCWESVPIEEARPFDVIVLNIAGHPNHVGVICMDKQFLHVERGGESQIERYKSRRWKSRIEGIYRYCP